MARLGNTPLRQTNFFLERGKSFAFTVSFVDKADKPLDMTAAELRLVVEEPKNFGGAEVIDIVAFEEDPANGVLRFQLQASDLLLEPAEYPYDVTLVPDMGYSSPILKGIFIIGYNTDDRTDNVYTGVDLSNGLVVTLDQGNAIKICMDYAIGLKGDKGEQGQVDVAATITGPPGSEASVVDLDPNPGRALFQFTIPRGDPGGTGGEGGVTDHGALLGLMDDDHTQYHTDARGDVRYLQLTGGTLTGDLVLAGDADQPLEAVTLQQLLAHVPSGGTDEVHVGPDTPPANQQIWIDTDEPDPVVGIGAAGYYRHDQAMPLITWVVNHQLGYRPAVHVQDAVGNVLYGTIAHLSDSVLTITFTNALTGSAHCS